MHEYCTLLNQDEIRLVGTKIRLCAESRGIPITHGTNTVRTYVKKLISNGTIGLFRECCGVLTSEIIAAYANIEGDGVYDLIVGISVESFESLPLHLPEYAYKAVIPSGEFVRMEINEKKQPERQGFGEQMEADEYFISDFRRETDYVFDKRGVSYNTFDENGEFIYKFEPVKHPEDYFESMDSFVMTPVILPDIYCACSVSGPEDEFVIFKYFKVQSEVFKLESASMYNDDYYGFPINAINCPLVSAFGSRVSSLEGLPECVEGHTIPGGLYLHIWQHEKNGDNPSMCYDVAFNHLDKLFFPSHPEYSQDNSRHVVARFRQANFASVFVPLIENPHDIP